MHAHITRSHFGAMFVFRFVVSFIAIMQLVWLCMNQPRVQRDRGARVEGSHRIPASAIYTPVILRDLRDLVNEPPHVDAGEITPESWRDSLACMHRHVYAIALIETGRPFSVFDELSEAELVVWDSYKMTTYRSDALLRVRFVEIACLDVWVGVWQTIRRAAPSGVFFNMSSFSYNNCVDEFEVGNTRSFADVISQWARRHNLNNCFDANGRIPLAVNMPIPHCLQVCAGNWTTWALPVPSNRRESAGLGYNLIRTLLQNVDLGGVRRSAVELSEDLEASDEVDMITPSGLNMMLNTLRRVFATAPTEALATQIKWLHRRRDVLLETKRKGEQKAFDMQILVRALMMAGTLRNMSSISLAVKYAATCAIQDPALLKHVLSDLQRPKALPSKSTVYRHQLTIHMGYCLLEQDLTKRMLEVGCVRFITVDTSPQGPFDWVMHGARTIRTDQLIEAMDWANSMADPALDDAQRTEIAGKLAPLVAMVQGVPTGLGSGRASVARKMHALAHSTRLYAPSWRHTAALLRDPTVAITGDQGVESLLPFFKTRLTKLFGRWVQDEDDGDEDAPPPADADDDFQIHGDADDRLEPEDDFRIHDEDQAEARDLPPGAPPVGDDYLIDLSMSLYWAGILHILHNTTRDLPAALSYWFKFLDMFKNVVRLVGKNRQT